MSGSGWIPRIGGCGPMWSGGRSPGTWRRPHPCSLWRAVVSLRSWREAILITYSPVDAVRTCDDAGRARPLQATLSVHQNPRSARQRSMPSFSPPGPPPPGRRR
jgi:hypothetical protein